MENLLLSRLRQESDSLLIIVQVLSFWLLYHASRDIVDKPSIVIFGHLELFVTRRLNQVQRLLHLVVNELVYVHWIQQRLVLKIVVMDVCILELPTVEAGTETLYFFFIV